MITGSLVAIALVLTYVAYTRNRATLGIGSAFFWGILSLWQYSLATNKNFGDIYFVIFWACIGMSLVMFIEAAFMKFGVSSEGSKNNGNNKEEKKEHKVESIDDLRVKHGIKTKEEARKEREAKNGGW